MNHELLLLRSWTGVWTGETEIESGDVLNIRISINSCMQGQGYILQSEVTVPSSGRLVRGLRMVFAQGPDGAVQTVTYSTQLGVFGLEQTQDDDDVIALAGVTESGVQLNVTFREEDPETLMFSVFWRPHGTSLPKDARPGLYGLIKRQLPWTPDGIQKPVKPV